MEAVSPLQRPGQLLDFGQISEGLHASDHRTIHVVQQRCTDADGNLPPILRNDLNLHVVERLARIQRAPQGTGFEARIAFEDVAAVHPDGFVRRIPGDPLRRSIEGKDPPVLADGEHPVRDAVEDRIELIPLQHDLHVPLRQRIHQTLHLPHVPERDHRTSYVSLHVSQRRDAATKGNALRIRRSDAHIEIREQRPCLHSPSDRLAPLGFKDLLTGATHHVLVRQPQNPFGGLGEADDPPFAIHDEDPIGDGIG